MNTAMAPDVPAHLQSFLAFDFGLKRTGVAAGNRLLRSAQAQPTIRAEGDARFEAVATRIREHENTVRARKFARQLHGRFKLPVFEVDERYSTTSALESGARDADAEAACIILEQFLRSLP
jgi:putative holliday junction resolvase